jgi:hypothetical protein
MEQSLRLGALQLVRLRKTHDDAKHRIKLVARIIGQDGVQQEDTHLGIVQYGLVPPLCFCKEATIRIYSGVWGYSFITVV